MINKIFYSLVLFPEISYDKALEGGMILKEVLEFDYGILRLIFADGVSEKSVYFCHKDVSSAVRGVFRSETKNWMICCDDIALGETISEIIAPKDLKDFNFFKDADHYRAIPFGAVFSITSKCNLFCYYCFNDYDYPLNERNKMENLSMGNIKDIIDKLYESGTRDIILSGGEPFLVPNLFEIIDYLVFKGFFIRINTNGSILTDSIIEKLSGYSLGLMISMHEFTKGDYYKANEKGAAKISGLHLNEKAFSEKFVNKLRQIRKINKNKSIYLDFLTILKPKNIISLEKLYYFVINNFSLNDWHFFRLYPTKRNVGIDKGLMKMAINKLYVLNMKYQVNHKIVDATPFCLIEDMDISKKVIEGELSEGHNIKTIINSNGEIQIMSAFDMTLGNIFKENILTIWNNEFVSKMLTNGFLPKECEGCLYRNECGGGSRMISNVLSGSYDSLDPLVDLDNKIIG